MRWSRQTTRTLVKFVIFACACAVLAVGLAVRIGNIQLFSSTPGYTVDLTDASGLIAGDEVKIAGVTVGRVNSVGVDHVHAVVSFDLQPQVHVRASTEAGLQWLDVIGQKVLYLYPGPTGPMLRPGGTIPLSQDVSDPSVGAFLNALGPFLQAIDPKEANAFLQAVAGTLQGDNAEVHSLISNAATVAGTAGSVSSQFGGLIANLDTVVSAVANHRGAVATVTNELAALAQTLASHNSLLDETVGNLGTVQAQLADLLRSNSSNLDTIITGLKGISRELAAHRGELAAGLHTLPEGLAPYQQISSYGQWFEIDPVFTCLADQVECSYQQPTNPAGGSSTPGASGVQGFYDTLAGGGP
jgi:phospholipid/cholesterol/gamma-HCH transport system substrate-binding protein